MVGSVSKSKVMSSLLAATLAVFSIGTVFAGDDDNDKKKNNSGEGVSDCGNNRNNCADSPSGSSDDKRLSGEVLAINTLVEPHEIILGTVDGRVTVKMFGKEGPFLVKQSGVKVKDYIEVSGYKEHESLFWADTISEPDDDDED